MFDVDAYIDQMDEEIYDEVLAALETDSYEKVAARFDIPMQVIEELGWYWVQD